MSFMRFKSKDVELPFAAQGLVM